MKKVFTALVLFLVSLRAFAQFDEIEDIANDFSDTVKRVFPIILGIIFLISFLFNAGYFFGENTDIKKGITRVLVFVVIAGAVAGLFTYIIGLSL